MAQNDSDPNELEELSEFDDLEDIVEPGGGARASGITAAQPSGEPELAPAPRTQPTEYSAQILQRMYTGMPAPFFNVNSRRT